MVVNYKQINEPTELEATLISTLESNISAKPNGFPYWT